MFYETSSRRRVVVGPCERFFWVTFRRTAGRGRAGTQTSAPSLLHVSLQEVRRGDACVVLQVLYHPVVSESASPPCSWSCRLVLPSTIMGRAFVPPRRLPPGTVYICGRSERGDGIVSQLCTQIASWFSSCQACADIGGLASLADVARSLEAANSAASTPGAHGPSRSTPAPGRPAARHHLGIDRNLLAGFGSPLGGGEGRRCTGIQGSLVLWTDGRNKLGINSSSPAPSLGKKKLHLRFDPLVKKKREWKPVLS